MIYSLSRGIMTIFLTFITPLLAAETAFAQSNPQATVPQPSFGETIFGMMPMIAVVFLIFYFLVVKPQNDKFKKQQELLSSLKKGDSVVTSSGIVGKISGIEDDYLSLELCTGCRVKFEKSHISKREGKEEKKEEKK